MNKVSINLGEYRTHGARIYTGRDRGEEVKKKSNINALSASNDEVNIIIPEDIITINPSFLEELFRDVVVRLGKENFYKKFRFTCLGPYRIEANLETAVDRILRKSSALK